jgi:hypothetical protein
VGIAVAERQRAGDPNLSTGGPIDLVKTTFGENLAGTDGTEWVTVASIRVNVTSGPALVVARFDADAECGPELKSVDGSCQLRIKALDGADHRPLRPSTMINALRVVSNVGEEDHSFMMEKSRVLPEGSWTIVVQHRVTNPTIYFGIYSHHLTVERAPV